MSEMDPNAVQWTQWSHVWDWYSHSRPSLSLGSSGPHRVTDSGDEDPEFKRRPVGFTAQIEPVEVEPDLWEGDGA